MAALLPYQHTRIFNAAAPGASALLHKTLMDGASSITPRRDAGVFRITAIFGADTTLAISITDNAGTPNTKTGLLSGGATFAAGKEYTVEVPFARRAKASAIAAEVLLIYDWVCGSNVAVSYFQCEELEESIG